MDSENKLLIQLSNQGIASSSASPRETVRSVDSDTLSRGGLNAKTPHIPGIPPVVTGGIPLTKAVTPML